MIEGVVNGAIDAIATDHAPHPGSEKMQEFEKCPFGILGLETALGVSFEHLLHPKKIGLKRLVGLFTTGPARILGIPRGTLAAGAAGDVTIFSLDREWTYDVNKSFSKSRNSPFDGKTFRGGPVATIVNGAIVWRAENTDLKSVPPSPTGLLALSAFDSQRRAVGCRRKRTRNERHQRRDFFRPREALDQRRRPTILKNSRSTVRDVGLLRRRHAP